MNGGRLVLGLAVVLVVGNLAVFALGTTDVSGIRMVVMSTARSSLTLFCLAFSAAALARLWPNELTAWQRRNRRQLGLGFALSHALHLGAVIALARVDPALFASLTTPVTIALGSVTYLLIGAMAATSFDAAVRRLGPARWRLLHRIAGYWIWTNFMVSFGTRAAHQPVYLGFVALLAATLAVRLLATERARAPRPLR